MSTKGLKDILQLGNPLLYEVCDPVLESELSLVKTWVKDLSNAMSEIREKYNFGRGIAAPQLGILKSLFYLDVDSPTVIINPELIYLSEDTFELWDDCMSFPNLLVKVKRHKKLTIRFRDENWKLHEWTVEGDLSELIQHEYDHLDGILCTMRAINDKSFKWRS